jgi:hypothetical protein
VLTVPIDEKKQQQTGKIAAKEVIILVKKFALETVTTNNALHTVISSERICEH